jgi:hypothetical protein
MKKTIQLGVVLLALAAWLSPLKAQNSETNQAKPVAIGVYDSRIVAYAYFWSPERQKELAQLMASAKAAKASGDTAELQARDKALREIQAHLHRQVFSTEPIDDVLAKLKDRLPALQKEAGCSRLVSKWDTQTLGSQKDVPQIEVTDLLAKEFKPGKKQLQVIEEIKRQKPVPLDKCED